MNGLRLFHDVWNAILADFSQFLVAQGSLLDYSEAKLGQQCCEDVMESSETVQMHVELQL